MADVQQHIPAPSPNPNDDLGAARLMPSEALRIYRGADCYIECSFSDKDKTELTAIHITLLDPINQRELLRISHPNLHCISSDERTKLTTALEHHKGDPIKALLELKDLITNSDNHWRVELPEMMCELEISKVFKKADASNFTHPTQARDPVTGLRTMELLLSDGELKKLQEKLIRNAATEEHKADKQLYLVSFDGNAFGIRNKYSKGALNSTLKGILKTALEVFPADSFELVRRNKESDEFVLILAATVDKSVDKTVQQNVTSFFTKLNDQYNSSRDNQHPDPATYPIQIRDAMRRISNLYESKAGREFTRDGYRAFLVEKKAELQEDKKAEYKKLTDEPSSSLGALELFLALNGVGFSQNDGKELFTGGVTKIPDGEILTAELVHRASGQADREMFRAKLAGSSDQLKEPVELGKDVKVRGSFTKEKERFEEYVDDYEKNLSVLKDPKSDYLQRIQAVLSLAYLESVDLASSALITQDTHRASEALVDLISVRTPHFGAYNKLGFDQADEVAHSEVDALKRYAFNSFVWRVGPGDYDAVVKAGDLTNSDIAQLSKQIEILGLPATTSDKAWLDLHRRAAFKSWFDRYLNDTSASFSAEIPAIKGPTVEINLATSYISRVGSFFS